MTDVLKSEIKVDYKKILKVVLREMMMYANRWRVSWRNFDGRTLRYQLSSLKAWAEDMLNDEEPLNKCDLDENGEFIGGTLSYKEEIEAGRKLAKEDSEEINGNELSR